MVTDFGGCDPNDNDRGGLQNQSRFRAIDQHGAALYGALSGASFGDERTAHAQLDWLAMSLGVRHVDIDTDPLGDSMYCGTAAAWDAVRSRHVSTFSEEVLRFLFLWGSLEAAARLAGMRRQDRTRPWVAARLDATRHRVLRDDLALVARDLRAALCGARAHGVERRLLGDGLTLGPRDAVVLAGAVRNSLAHGWSDFPAGSPPDLPEIEWATTDLDAEILVLSRSRRAIQLVIQALLVDCALVADPEPGFLDVRTDEDRSIQDALVDLHLAEWVLDNRTLPFS
ncbi:MAG: hypothetical protein M3N98_05695 [Actinomycetota bacterium]|nr:hypothetical protein [Actinomycetota bacterium]